MQIGADELSAAIQEIYAAVAEPNGNPDQLSKIVARCVDSESGLFQFMNAAPAALVGGTPAILSCPSSTTNIDAAARAAYVEHYHDVNIWYKEGSKRGWPTIVLCHELFEERTFLRSEWGEYCRARDWFHCIGVQFRLEGNFVAAFGAHRPQKARTYDEDSRRVMAVLLPHIQRACQMLHRLGAAAEHRRLTLGLLDRLQMGSIMVNADGHIRWANAVAERVLRRGTELTVHCGYLRTADPRHVRQLERSIFEAAELGGSAGGLLHIHRAAGAPLSLLIAPLQAPFLLSKAGSSTLILFSDPDARPVLSSEAVASTYALTKAENDLLLSLVAGETLTEYSLHRDVSYNTTRTHMARILRKSGFRRQTDLIRTVMSNPLLRSA